jgi:hypothetical protein
VFFIRIKVKTLEEVKIPSYKIPSCYLLKWNGNGTEISKYFKNIFKNGSKKLLGKT